MAQEISCPVDRISKNSIRSVIRQMIYICIWVMDNTDIKKLDLNLLFPLHVLLEELYETLGMKASGNLP